MIFQRLFFTLCWVFTGMFALQAQDLRFHPNGKFKVAQFTDLHWTPGSAESEVRVPQVIQQVVRQEKPDLLIFTGDVITARPAQKGWEYFVKMCETIGVPYAVLMGNHDPEMTTKDSIYSYLEKQSLFVGEKGPKGITGMGNFVLPILASDGSSQVKALIYGMDSNDYSPNEERYGYYGWIEFNQIAWYHQQSEKYTERNGGNPLPALAFFHIPTPEFRLLDGKEDTYGTALEGIGGGAPEVNTGMHAAFLNRKDVMGIFVGHDHQNDLIGQINGITLAYGRASGYDAYGELERGGRIIELEEGSFKFQTWVSTPKGKDFTYYYPSGITSTDEAELTYYPAQSLSLKKNGVNYTYYEGIFKCLQDITTKGQLIEKGTMPHFIIDKAPVEDHYAYVFESWIDIPETAVYRFFVNSDDGAKLYIDGKLLVDNDGSHSVSRKGAKVALDKGFHEIKIEYFENYMGQELKVRMSSRNMPEQLIPEKWLYIK